jgi:hypothetical protein
VPSTANNFLYSLVTMMMVGTILTFSFASYVNPLREISEVNKLKEVINHVAARAEEALATINECNATLSIVIPLPSTIGDRDYWVRFANDSSSAWVEGAFGKAGEVEGQKYRVYLPREAIVSGIFEGRYVLALLNCSLEGTLPKLNLTPQSG